MMRSLVMGAAFMAGAAQAEGCPDFYRFVDFGLDAGAGIVTRGGPIFRVESFEGEALQDAATICRDVYPVAADGHGNPIPVVSRLSYDPEALDLPVDRLDLWQRADSAADAMAVERRHRRVVARGAVRSDALSLCAVEGAMTSCQVASPLGAEVPVIVICDAGRCAATSIAVHPRIALSAEWDQADAGPVSGADAAARVERIIATLRTLTTALDR